MNCRNYQVKEGILPREHLVANPDELIEMSAGDITLCLFVIEVKNANGNDYNRDTLYDYHDTSLSEEEHTGQQNERIIERRQSGTM